MPSYKVLTFIQHCYSFRLYRNGNPDYVTATFDVPDVRKEDVHVAFQNSQLTITWESIITTERRSDDRTIIREKKERKYARTLPLPPDTEVYNIFNEYKIRLMESDAQRYSSLTSKHTWKMVF
jgi:hypothetical protein